MASVLQGTEQNSLSTCIRNQCVCLLYGSSYVTKTVGWADAEKKKKREQEEREEVW